MLEGTKLIQSKLSNPIRHQQRLTPTDYGRVEQLAPRWPCRQTPRSYHGAEGSTCDFWRGYDLEIL